MVKVIMGEKGTGKTKLLIDMVNRAAEANDGSVVCIEGGRNLTYDIKYSARLTDYFDYPIEKSFDSLFAFICGIYAQNFDISHVFIDSLYKIAGPGGMPETEAFLKKLEDFGAANHVDFTVMITADKALASDEVRKYF